MVKFFGLLLLVLYVSCGEIGYMAESTPGDNPPESDRLGYYGAYEYNADLLYISILALEEVSTYDAASENWNGVVTLNSDTVSAQFYFQERNSSTFNDFSVKSNDTHRILLSGDLRNYAFNPKFYLNTQNIDTMYSGVRADSLHFHISRFYQYNFTAYFGADTIVVDIIAPQLIVKKGTQTKIINRDVQCPFYSDVLLGKDSEAFVSSLTSSYGDIYYGECVWEKVEDTLKLTLNKKVELQFLLNEEGDIFTTTPLPAVDSLKVRLGIYGDCELFIEQTLEFYVQESLWYL